LKNPGNFRSLCGGHLTDDARHLVAGGKASELADPSAANKARALPLPAAASGAWLGTMARRRARIKRYLANAFFGVAEK
jgi:hypothetical protein